MNNKFTLSLFFLAVLAMVSCKKKDNDTTPEVDTNAVKTEFLITYANIAFANTSEAKNKATALQTAINTLISAPTANNLTACKTAYSEARMAYLQCEVFRGVNGPIDEEDGAPESWINSWPLDEAYIDYVFGNNSDTIIGGMVNDGTTDLTKANLLGLNFQGGDANVATGFHAIEFLLWGQDIYADGPGKRPFSDYIVGAGASAPNAARRAIYLKVCAELLAENLGTVASDWDPNGGEYRSDFLSIANRDARLKTVLSGMTKLSKNEFGGERILPGLDNQDQEEEHSCFSDLTKMDFKYDAVGYENVILGKYGTVSGTGILKLVEAFSKDNASKLKTASDSLILTSQAVYDLSAPYDQIIIPTGSASDKDKVKAMSNAWIKVSDALNLATQSLGYGTVDTTPEP